MNNLIALANKLRTGIFSDYNAFDPKDVEEQKKAAEIIGNLFAEIDRTLMELAKE